MCLTNDTKDPFVAYTLDCWVVLAFNIHQGRRYCSRIKNNVSDRDAASTSSKSWQYAGLCYLSGLFPVRIPL